jgi:fatty-acyl-CoA synthase
MPSPIYDQDLGKTPANYVPLTPLSFLVRAARIYPNRVAVIHGSGESARRYTYAELFERCRRLASALARRGIGRGDTVAVLAPNIPAMLEAHYGIPMTGGVLCAVNTRLDAPAVAFILRHSETRIFMVDRELASVAAAALAEIPPDERPVVVDIDDALATSGTLIGSIEYEALLAEGDPAHPVRYPDDEWDAITLAYTSGTTGDPKGVVCHHRGAYLNAAGNALAFGITPRTVYLWTLPMFHCNGWTYTWGITLQGGTHVCLRRVDPALIYPMIAEHKVTHMCAAPVVMTMLIHAPDSVKTRVPWQVELATGGAAPPSAVIDAMEALGFRVTHLYGLTEVYGPLTFCLWQPELDRMDLNQRAAFTSRQGVPHPMAEAATVMSADMVEVPADAATIGELMLRGNTVAKGYLKNRPATEAVFAGGWFHSGDLGVLHSDHYVEIKDRSKDIIISGGENISSLEVEEVLYRHPDVMEAAVVAHADEKWGEVPHAFVTPKQGREATISADDILAFCRANLARFKCPRYVSFVQLPKTSTGKIQKHELRRRLKEGLEETKPA